MPRRKDSVGSAPCGFVFEDFRSSRYWTASMEEDEEEPPCQFVFKEKGKGAPPRVIL